MKRAKIRSDPEALTESMKAVAEPASRPSSADSRLCNSAVLKSVSTDPQLAQGPERFLRERYLNENPVRDAIATCNSGRYYIDQDHIRQAASKLRLRQQSFDMPSILGTWDDEDKWIVVGPTSSAVASKVAEVQKEAKEAHRQTIIAKQEHIDQQHAQVVSQVDLAVEWDVSGTWAIDFPEIQSGYCDGERELNIAPVSEKAGARMWARFNFLILTGVFRFAKDGEVIPSEDEGSDEIADGSSEEGDEEEETDDDSSNASTPSSAKHDHQPSYPVDFRPSSDNRHWKYRWRGVETGEHELQIFFDLQKGYLTFGGPGGTKLWGEFDSGYTGRKKFTGSKIKNKSARVSDWEGRFVPG